jgi:hypothetical protein
LKYSVEDGWLFLNQKMFKFFFFLKGNFWFWNKHPAHFNHHFANVWRKTNYFKNISIIMFLGEAY